MRVYHSDIDNIKNLMLRKLSDSCKESPLFAPGQEIFLVTREGELLEGFCVDKVLADLVSLDRPPLPGDHKQGLTIHGDILKPNWCAGRRAIVAGCRTREEAHKLAQRRKKGGTE